MRKMKSEVKNYRLELGLLSLIFFLFLGLNFLVPYLPGDDFIYHYKFTPNGLDGRIESIGDVFSSQYHHYFQRNGRIISHAFEQVFTLFQTKIVFNIFNAFVFLLLPFLITGIGKQALPNWKDLPVILSLCLVIWLFNPEFGECFLWVSGAFNYLWSPCILLLFLFTFIQFNKKQWSNKAFGIKIVSIFFLGLLAGWTNENSSFATIGMLSLFIIISIYNKEKVKAIEFAALLGLMVGFYFLATAGGNSARLADLSDGGQNFSVADFMIRMIKYFFLYYYGAWLWIAWGISVSLLINNSINVKANYLKFAVLFFLGALFSNMVMIAAKGYYPTRAIEVGFLFLLISGTSIFYGTVKEGYNWISLFQKVNISLFVLLIILNVFWSIPYYWSIYSVNQERELIIDDYIQKQKKGIVYLPPFPSRSGPYFFIRDIEKDSKNFVNRISATYYQVDSIALTKE